MSSVEPPILLKTKLPEILPTAQLERCVTVAGNHARRRARCPMINNENDPELACKVYEEFQDICTAERLDLNTGPLKFEFIRQCMTGQARAHWDVAVANAGGNGDNEFNEAIVEWFSQYFEPTAYHDQKQYFLQATKAFAMSVKETATRVEEIIRYMSYMPGAPAAGTPVYSDVEKKMTLYRLMRNNWKTNFDASGNQITDNAFTWNNLITYFAAQEKKENKRAIAGVPTGRGYSAGGRGYGRGRGRFGGRGRGGYGQVRRQFDQGGRPTQRFRPNGYGYNGQGYLPAPYGQSYGGYGQYGRGYGQTNSYGGYAYGGGRGYGRGAGRGGRGMHAGGRGAGRGGRGHGREAAALQNDPGYAYRPNRSTRSGQVYLADGSEAPPQESFDSGNTSHETEVAEPAHPEEMFYGEGENGGDFETGYAFDDMDYGYQEEYGGYGDY